MLSTDINLTTVICAAIAAVFGGGAAGRLTSLAARESLRDTFVPSEEAKLKYLTKDEASEKYFTIESLRMVQDMADKEHKRISDDINKLAIMVKDASDMAHSATQIAENTRHQMSSEITQALSVITDRIETMMKLHNETVSIAATAAVTAVLEKMKNV